MITIRTNDYRQTDTSSDRVAIMQLDQLTLLPTEPLSELKNWYASLHSTIKLFRY